MTLTRSKAGWTIEGREDGTLWWSVTYPTEAEARETLRQMEEENKTMSRQSNDEMKDGLVFNGFDYELQVWVIKEIIQGCGHPREMSRPDVCCNAKKYAGRSLANVLAERGIRQALGR